MAENCVLNKDTASTTCAHTQYIIQQHGHSVNVFCVVFGRVVLKISALEFKVSDMKNSHC